MAVRGRAGASGAGDPDGLRDSMVLLEGLAILAFVVGPLVVFAWLLGRYRRRRQPPLR